MPTRDDQTIDIPSPAEMASPRETVLDASPEDFTGGPVLEQVVQGAQELSEHRLREANREFSLGTRVTTALQETPTAHITRALVRNLSDPEFQDFDPDLDHYGNAKELLQRYALPDNEHTLEIIAQAGTAEDQAILARRLQSHDFNQRVLAEHGGWAFAAQILDPTFLIADFVTFGTTRALNLGRTATAVTGAATFTGVMGAADASGMETSTFDYVLGAALTGGAFALFGGQAANRIRAGEANWYGRVTPKARPFQGLTEFLSEADTLIARTPETAPLLRQLIDDPVRRTEFTANNNAASLNRRNQNELDAFAVQYDNFVETHLARTQGFNNLLTRRLDRTGAYSTAKDTFNREVANELLERNQQFMSQGFVSDGRQVNPAVREAADIYERMMNRAGEIARDSGLPGFENFTPQPGYFHRSWNGAKIHKVGPDNARRLIRQSITAGIRGISDEDAAVLARAIVDRAQAKRAGTSVDFMGAFSRGDTRALRELLEAGGLREAELESAMRRIGDRLDERATSKYAKTRIPMDMTARVELPGGQSLSMMDLIDTDLDRLARNYNGVMGGRSALAKAGIGGTDRDIQAFRDSYRRTLEGLPNEQINRAMTQLDGVLADFTGNIPPQNRLSPMAQRWSSLSTSVMLTASGMWQAIEYSTMAFRYGAAETAKEFFKSFPGVRQQLQRMNGNADLADELGTVFNLDLARDVRFRPWMRQHDEFLDASNTMIDRALHFGKQAIPYVNGMKYIHAHQSRMNLNLASNKLARALAGDEASIRMVREYAPDLDLAAMRRNTEGLVQYKGKNATEMNWGAWADADADAAINVIMRMADDAILFGRSGQGTAFARSATGQILGQFRSFVAFAHNKLLRGTLHNGGKPGGELALAKLLAYQYPATVLMVAANDARQGRLDVSSDNAIEDLMKRGIGYTAGLGFFADAAGIVGATGGRGGVGVPVMGLTQAPMYAASGINKALFDGEFRQGSGDVAKAASLVIPLVNGLPGTAAAIEAMRSD